VILHRGQMGFDLAHAKLGPLEVSLDDTALGISLAMRTHGWPGERCALLVEAFWRDGELDVVFASMKALDPSAVAHITHAEIEDLG
jgi:hypothetical protein